MSPPTQYPITRESLASGTFKQLVEDRDGDDHDMLNEAELLASRRRMVPDDVTEDVWLFGYGSLIWNPVVKTSDTRLGRIYGYRRRFCLRTQIGRGTPETPGLVLGLDHGGSCTGVALKIDGDIPHELDLLWRREMLNHSYNPAWVNVHTEHGLIRALTFVMNRQHKSYVPELTLDEKVDMIANAHGFIGPCKDYLDETRASLNALGITDHYLEEISHRVDNLPQR